MAIPSQNEFLLPFLQILGDGKTYKRSEMLFRLAKHFNISQEEAQQMSGSQFTLVSRVTWCDVHFCKAGFVDKQQHHSDSTQDTFRITSLGVRELRFRADRLTVGYLQGFYRSKIHRGAGSDDSTSDAELQLYEQLESLTDEYEIFHSVKWFAKKSGTVGEADFLIVHPQRGILVLEVKGGVVQINNGEWSTTNRFGQTYTIKDPCAQADRSRRHLRDWLTEDSRTKKFNFVTFPAVALPDSRVSNHIRPDCTEDIFIDIRHLNDLKSRIKAIFDYWTPRADGNNQKMDGQAAVNALIDLLEPTRQLQPKISDVFERERRKIDELTQQQFMVLRMLRQRKRAAIIGGAGTGKTMLAMEKAQQLLDSGYRVLMLCYNQNLKQWLEQSFQNPNLMVATFHGLAGYAVNWARIPRPPAANFYDQAADLLLSAAQVLQAECSDKLFDAIIVDEGQDFEDTWWIPLPDLLKDRENGVFYIFFDDNQRIYQQIGSIPFDGEPLQLPDNCRNTQHIHAQMSAYAYLRQYDTECFGPEGRPIEMITAKTEQEAKKELQRLLHRLVNEEGVRCEDIIMLTGASEKRSQWKQDEQLGNFILSWNMDTEMDLALRVCTIYSYKGLENAVVILTELDKAREEVRDQVIYVGLSRARHHAVVIGELPEPRPNGVVEHT